MIVFLTLLLTGCTTRIAPDIPEPSVPTREPAAPTEQTNTNRTNNAAGVPVPKDGPPNSRTAPRSRNASASSGPSPVQIVYNNARGVIRTKDGAVLTARTERGEGRIERTFNGATTSVNIPETNIIGVSVESDGGDLVVASWASGRGSAIHAMVSTDGGSTWGAASRIASGRDLSPPSLRIWSSNGSPTVVATWHQGQQGGHAQIWTTTFHNRSWSTPQRIDSGSAEASFATVTGLGDKSWILWRDTRSGDKQLYISSRNTVTGQFGGERAIGIPGLDPSACVEPNGRMHVAYHHAQALMYVQSTDQGQTWGQPITVDPVGLFGRVLCDGTGKVAIVWEDMYERGSIRDDANKSVGLAVSTDGGGSFRTIDIAERERNQILPTAFLAQNGTIELAWVDRNANALRTESVNPW